MARKYGNTTLILLQITVLVMLLHPLIPHDHHYGNSTEINHNPAENNEKGQSHFHCYFLNDLVKNKISTSFQNRVKRIILPFKHILTPGPDFSDKPAIKIFIQKVFHFPGFGIPYTVSPTRGSPLSFPF